MAREESDREDLLAEATALVERVELAVERFESHSTLGFRRNGAFSAFFGADPVYQFNSAGELRRAFVRGLLYKTESGKLASLRRERIEGKAILSRRDLSAAETREFLSMAESLIRQLSEAIRGQHYQEIGRVPHDCEVVARCEEYLRALPSPLRLASTPHAR